MSKAIFVELFFEGDETDKFIKDLIANGWNQLAESMAHQVQRQCKCVDCKCGLSQVE